MGMFETPSEELFHHGLAMAASSETNLPKTLKELAERVGNERKRRILCSMAEEVADGVPLSETMARHPSAFTNFQIRMAEAGEKSETLKKTLAEAAKISTMELKSNAMLRRLVLLFIGGMTITIPILAALWRSFLPLFNYMLGGWWAHPWYCVLMTRISELITKHWNLWMVISAFSILFFLLILFAPALSRSIISLIGGCLPGTHRARRALDTMRLAAAWSALGKQGIHSVDALPIAAGLLDSRKMAKALRRVAKKCAAGEPLPFLMEKEKAIPPMLTLTVRHVPESELPEKLAELADLLRAKTSASLQSAYKTWRMLAAFFLITLIVLAYATLLTPWFIVIKIFGSF